MSVSCLHSHVSPPAHLSPSTPVLLHGPRPPTMGRNSVTPSKIKKKKKRKKLKKLSPCTESQPAGWIKSSHVKHIAIWPEKATKAGYKMLVACSHPSWPRTPCKPALKVLVWPSSNRLIHHQETKLLDLTDEEANKRKSSEINHNQWQKPHCQIQHQHVYLMGPPCPRKGDRLDDLCGFSNANT